MSSMIRGIPTRSACSRWASFIRKPMSVSQTLYHRGKVRMVGDVPAEQSQACMDEAHHPARLVKRADGWRIAGLEIM